MNELPSPLTSPQADLRDFPFTPVFRARLFGSSFHARADDAQWRAGVTLWLKSWDQQPAGSLPDDDIDLCRLAELGRDLKTWKRLRAGAMRGWVKCSDGRLYHPVVAEGVNEAWQGKLKQRWKTECARIKKQNQRCGTDEAAPSFEEFASRCHLANVPDDSHTLSLVENETVPRDIAPVSLGTDRKDNGDNPSTSTVTKPNVPGETVSKGKGERKGQGEEIVAADARAGVFITDAMHAELLAAAGNSLNLPASPDLQVMARPLHWLQQGADWELDVIPTIKIHATKGRPFTIRSWNYFDGPIADAMARRTRPMPKGNANERASDPQGRQGTRLDHTLAGIFRAGGE